ncbi:hypothetical protein SBA3_2010008 [Candidatus Sulfopaludibacter sp. SbA3]|nr:hypothetical protein SBA3_2010008 [Candidatus Sulfopaludibacter sp. SbA3]
MEENPDQISFGTVVYGGDCLGAGAYTGTVVGREVQMKHLDSANLASSRLVRRRLARRDENGGENASGFREGANSSQARSRRGKLEPGTKIRQKAANFEPGTDLQRIRGSGFSREGGTVCGGPAAQDFSREAGMPRAQSPPARRR